MVDGAGCKRGNTWRFSMSDGRIVIGNRRYSSWSMRGWLPVALAGLEVTEVMIPLSGGSTSAIKEQTPSGLVPYL
jgi:glutathione S-transferase